MAAADVEVYFLLDDGIKVLSAVSYGALTS